MWHENVGSCILWWAAVNTVMNIRIPKNTRNFLGSWMTVICHMQ